MAVHSYGLKMIMALCVDLEETKPVPPDTAEGRVGHGLARQCEELGRVGSCTMVLCHDIDGLHGDLLAWDLLA